MENFIYRFFAHDKMLHYFFGSLIAMLGLISYLYDGYILAIIVYPIIIGVLKEGWDLIFKSKFNWLDILFTALPGILITTILLIFN